MRVQRQGVGAVDALQPLSAPLGELEEAAVGRVDVQPQPLLRAMSAIAGKGSITPVLVVPAVATTRNGCRPIARSAATAARNPSGSMRRPASTGTIRIAREGRPASSAALATDWCACPVTYSVPARKFSGSSADRAVTTADSVAIDAPVVTDPADREGRPNRPASHRSMSASSATRPGAAKARLV